jgi:hypothetical protein
MSQSEAFLIMVFLHQNLCRTTKVHRSFFARNFRILHPTNEDAYEVEAFLIVSYDQILCRTIKFCVVRSNFVSRDKEIV